MTERPTHWYTEPQRLALCEWLTLHGIDPGLVPLNAEFRYELASNEWTVDFYEPDANGKIHLIPGTEDVARSTVTFEGLAPFPLGG